MPFDIFLSTRTSISPNNTDTEYILPFLNIQDKISNHKGKWKVSFSFQSESGYSFTNTQSLTMVKMDIGSFNNSFIGTTYSPNYNMLGYLRADITNTCWTVEKGEQPPIIINSFPSNSSIYINLVSSVGTKQTLFNSGGLDYFITLYFEEVF